MPAIDPPIFQSPVIIQAIIKVSSEAVILYVIVFSNVLLVCSILVSCNISLKYFWIREI